MKKKNLWPALLVLFLVAFPKGGLKVGEVPLTIGYVLLFLVAAWAAIRNSVTGRYQAFPIRNVQAYAATLPLLLISALTLGANGTDSVAYTIAYLVGFGGLPLIFLIIFAPQFQALDREAIHRYVRRAISFVSLYGIFLFVWLLVTGKFIEIPFLTINADDAGHLADKNIQRGDGIFKLISTYNNGNVYGVAILMLLPVYDRVQSSKLWKLIARASLVLTLSRTVWIGMIAYELISSFYIGPLRKRTLVQLSFGIIAVVAVILYVLASIGLNASFLFDSNLGGRSEVVNATRWLIVSETPVEFRSEIIAVNIVGAFGVTGLVAFAVSVLAPIWLAATGKNRSNRLTRSYISGMAMLLICGLSDGPILLIPTMAFYWALGGLAIISSKPAVSNQMEAAPTDLKLTVDQAKSA